MKDEYVSLQRQLALARHARRVVGFPDRQIQEHVEALESKVKILKKKTKK